MVRKIISDLFWQFYILQKNADYKNEKCLKIKVFICVLHSKLKPITLFLTFTCCYVETLVATLVIFSFFSLKWNYGKQDNSYAILLYFQFLRKKEKLKMMGMNIIVSFLCFLIKIGRLKNVLIITVFFYFSHFSNNSKKSKK